MEAYRFFRLNYFKNVDEFYEEFFEELNDPKIKLFLEKREGAIKEVKRKSLIIQLMILSLDRYEITIYQKINTKKL